MKVLDATGEVIFKTKVDRVSPIFVIKLMVTHEDVGERGGCEDERNDGLAEHCFSTVKKERYLRECGVLVKSSVCAEDT